MTEERINTEDAPRIAERVKFWEEQDRINQELIPRVIRQNELLTGHIADHENLPLIAGNAINEALAEAREEQSQHHKAALAALQEETRKIRNLVVAVAAGAAVISTVAIVVAILAYVGGSV